MKVPTLLLLMTLLPHVFATGSHARAQHVESSAFPPLRGGETVLLDGLFFSIRVQGDRLLLEVRNDAPHPAEISFARNFFDSESPAHQLPRRTFVRSRLRLAKDNPNQVLLSSWTAAGGSWGSRSYSPQELAKRRQPVALGGGEWRSRSLPLKTFVVAYPFREEREAIQTRARQLGGEIEYQIMIVLDEVEGAPGVETESARGAGIREYLLSAWFPFPAE